MGGVRTLQAPGSERASVWLMVKPSEAAPPFIKEHRHCGDD